MEWTLKFLCQENINFLFSVVSWISFTVCMIPTISPDLLGGLQVPENSSITTALLSKENKVVLIVSLCLTGPLFIDLFMRVIISAWSPAPRKSIAPLAILLLSLVLPNAAFLIPLVARLGYNVFNFIINIRFILAVWSILSLMNGLSNKIWNKQSAFALYIIVNISVVMNYYIIFVKINLLAAVMEWIIGIFSVVTFYMLLRISFRWYTYVYHSTKTNVLSTEQYLGCIYMSSLLFLFLWSFGTFFYSMSGSKLYDDTTVMVILQDMKYTVFYVMLIVFENRAMQRDMTMTKVGLIICNGYELWGIVHYLPLNCGLLFLLFILILCYLILLTVFMAVVDICFLNEYFDTN